MHIVKAISSTNILFLPLEKHAYFPYLFMLLHEIRQLQEYVPSVPRAHLSPLALVERAIGGGNGKVDVGATGALDLGNIKRFISLF